MRQPGYLLPAIILFALSSCATSSRDYVDESVGYSVAKGFVVRVDGLSSDGKEYLANGVALKISKGGGQVSMKMGEQIQELPFHPGSILVYSDSGDYLLDPISKGTGQSETQPKAK